jgi:hypothetical protein
VQAAENEKRIEATVSVLEGKLTRAEERLATEKTLNGKSRLCRLMAMAEPMHVA